jgi:hypothetical protein
MKLLLAVILSSPFSSRAEVIFTPNTRFRFTSPDQARQVLTNRDDFIARLSSFDRAARLKTPSDVSESQFLAFVATNILAFTPDEISRVELGLEHIKPKIDALKLPWPELISFIKTTGAEEGDAAYTRANAIIFPRSKLASDSVEPMDALLAHELFHILSRHNPALKEKLYQAIGFNKCAELQFPPNLFRITNPDAPRNDHWIPLKMDGRNLTAIPILFADPPKYDPQIGGEFFRYLQFKFLVVQTNGLTGIDYQRANPVLLDPAHVRGFFEQVGQNTKYVIHPEEILADNFKLLITGAKNLHNPELLEKLHDILLSSQK